MTTIQILNLASSFCNMIDDQNEVHNYSKPVVEEVILTLEQEVL